MTTKISLGALLSLWALIIASLIFPQQRVLLVVISIPVLIVVMGLQIIPRAVERSKNEVLKRGPYTIPKEVQEIHQKQFTVDLHADALLWNRNLLAFSDFGHVDIPRMVQGNVGFQVFGVVTKSPKGQNFDANDDASDNITLLAAIQAWPVRTWGSLLQRALYQAEKLDWIEKASRGQFIFVKSVKDLDQFLTKRAENSMMTAGFPGLEGVHALEGKLENLDLLYAAGFRMIGLTHFFDNEAGGSAHGLSGDGLTSFGKEVVKRVQQNGMILDLAHASPKMVDDALNIATAPVVVSHTGVRGTCDNVRNLSDTQMRGIAATGGVMGIAMFEQAVCGETVAATARAMRYAADLVGVDHVAFGSDFDGSVKVPVDTSGVGLLTGALMQEGFNTEEIGMIMGANALRVFHETLPDA
ncbi:MAG: dipeptidase [Anaerolineaceae bacterium]|nr:dipeptidase [Anaerolineaceae bacterium]